MIETTVEILSDQGNAAVIRLPERKHPGVVLQGDTLHSLVTLAGEVASFLKARDEAGAQQAVEALGEQLDAIQERYESALTAAGITLPY